MTSKVQHPWFKVDSQKWRSDPALRMCGLAARGLAIELMALAHDADPYGSVILKGRPPTVEQLGRMVGAPEDEVSGALQELLEVGVFEKNADGVIIARDLVEERERYLLAAAYGARGGRPRATANTATPENKGGVNPPLKGSSKGGVKLEVEEEKEGEEERTTDTSQHSETLVSASQAKRRTIERPKGTRLPDDWVLPKEWGEWAMEQRRAWAWTRDDVLRCAELFKAHWHSDSTSNAVKRSWRATWTKWVLSPKSDGIRPKERRNDGKAERRAATLAGLTGVARDDDQTVGFDPARRTIEGFAYIHVPDPDQERMSHDHHPRGARE